MWEKTEFKVQIQPLTTCLMWGKLLHLPELQYPYLKKKRKIPVLPISQNYDQNYIK